jgi:hypothetical protein
MTRYKQYATTAFNGRDFSILHVEPTSPPQAETLNATTYLDIWTKIFQPPSSTSSSINENDKSVTNALTYAVTWLLRLYDDVFPDDAHTPLSHLRNFLAIPQQFMVTCLQFANYSVPAGFEEVFGTRFALPDDMRTVAVRGRSTTRLLALGWVVWVYIASAAVVVLGVGGVVVWMVVRREGIPGSSGFVEVDLAARFRDGDAAAAARGGDEDGDGDGDGLRVIRDLGRSRELRTAVTSSSFRVARELRRRRIRVVSVANGQRRTAGYETFTFREGVQAGRFGDAEARSRSDMLVRPDTQETRVASPRIQW